MNEQELIRKAMGALGRRTSEEKKQAAKENLAKAHAARRKPVAQIRCTCPTPNKSVKVEDHRKSCLRYRALKRREATQSP